MRYYWINTEKNLQLIRKSWPPYNICGLANSVSVNVSYTVLRDVTIVTHITGSSTVICLRGYVDRNILASNRTMHDNQ